jgi:hypothetical protein
LKYKGADIQLLDLPGLIKGAAKGKGRGKEILSAIRNVDLLLLMVDALSVDQLELMEKELYQSGIRLNQTSPDVVITKKGHGGITINTTQQLTHLKEKVIKSIASEFIVNANITIRDDITEDQLIDSFSQNRVYVPAMVLINKKDLIAGEIQTKLSTKIKKKGWHGVLISAEQEDGLDELTENVFSTLNLIRIYMKPVGKQTDYGQPLILRKGDSVADACKKLHRDFAQKFRYASLSGPSAKHDMQKVGLDHKLKDTDILTIVIWRQ